MPLEDDVKKTKKKLHSLSYIIDETLGIEQKIGCCWPTDRGNFERTGFVDASVPKEDSDLVQLVLTNSGFVTAFKVDKKSDKLWSKELFHYNETRGKLRGPYSNLAIGYDRIYCVLDGFMIVLNFKGDIINKKKEFKFKNRIEKNCDIVYKNNRLIVSSQKGLSCFDRDGNREWDFKDLNTKITLPTITDDAIYFNSGDPKKRNKVVSYVGAIDLNGKEKWRFDFDKRFFEKKGDWNPDILLKSSSLIFKDYIIFSYNSGIFTLDREGNFIWEFTPKDIPAILGPPTKLTLRGYTVISYLPVTNTLYFLNAKTGTILHDTIKDAGIHSYIPIHSGKIYVKNIYNHNSLTEFEIKDKRVEERWTIISDNDVGQPIINDKYVIFNAGMSIKGDFMILDRTDLEGDYKINTWSNRISIPKDKYSVLKFVRHSDVVLVKANKKLLY